MVKSGHKVCLQVVKFFASFPHLSADELVEPLVLHALLCGMAVCGALGWQASWDALSARGGQSSVRLPGVPLMSLGWAVLSALLPLVPAHGTRVCCCSGDAAEVFCTVASRVEWRVAF